VKIVPFVILKIAVDAVHYENYCDWGVCMKKRMVLIMALVLVALLFTGCETTQIITTKNPLHAFVSFPGVGTYKVLGRVDFTVDKDTGGYLDFLTYAVSVYPDTDDLVNILVDTDERYMYYSNGLGESLSLLDSQYKMSGIAIQYLP
jgi:hypothetical protein